MNMIATLSGFVGSIIILAGFAYVNILKRAPDILFNLLNLVGAMLLAVSLSIHVNVPALMLELAWAGIALFGIVTTLWRKSQ
jgi:hypothetical protein